MPKTNAERQRHYRQRRAGRITALEAEAAELRAEAGVLRTDLAATLSEAERLASTACRHPAGARRRDMATGRLRASQPEEKHRVSSSRGRLR